MQATRFCNRAKPRRNSYTPIRSVETGFLGSLVRHHVCITNWPEEFAKVVSCAVCSRATDANILRDAEDCVSRIEAKVVLIDGETLAQMMIDHNVGVSTVGTYEAKKIDSDYFSDD